MFRKVMFLFLVGMVTYPNISIIPFLLRGTYSGNSKLGESNAAEKLRLLLAIVRCCIADAIRPTPLHAMILEYYLLKDLLQQRYRKLR